MPGDIKLRNLYDVQQLLEKFGILVHLGKRLWDIELMTIELEHVYTAGLLDAKIYVKARAVLRRERENELRQQPKNHESSEQQHGR
ncbi:YqgQ family protein [Schleiferilactobacillus shenzhenensis]|uniref:YqgQ n=1 Tax=Schleiferilactobacillus shenzhenensis LY-73 TaxID=1231336 RepID=U4TVW5_9LACO|nr:YqgQ family protein [Schleiferilactobacillus shenzhenensis]ERL65537.1 YqgQ [Schleiferilactobacillus shenzhenensis LY-73]